MIDSRPSRGTAANHGLLWPTALIAIVCALGSLPDVSFAQTDPYEPNDQFQDAYVIQSGEILNGYIFPGTDIDWFTFDHTGGDIEVSVTSIPVGADYDVCLWPEQGASVCSDQPENGDEGILATGAPPGQYWVEIYAYQEATSDENDPYTLQVTFGSTGGGNDPPVVTVSSPNGGEQWAGGSTQTITYDASDPNSDNLSITLEYSTNGGSQWTQIASNQSDTGSYSWTLPDVNTTQGRVRVSASDGQESTSDTSNGNFSIVSTPGGSNELSVSSGSGVAGGQVTVQLRLDNENSVKGIQTDLTFNPDVVSFVSANAAGRAGAMSDSSRTVSSGKARVVLYSTDNSFLSAGNGIVADLVFSLKKAAGGQNSSVTPTSSILSDPTGLVLNVTEGAGTIGVSGGGGALSVTVLSPNGGESWAGGSVESIDWLATGGEGDIGIALEYSTNGGTNWIPIVPGPANNTGSYSWSVPSVTTARARVRASASDDTGTAVDASDGDFSILTSSGGNTLSFGSASGASGSTVSIPVSISNNVALKGIQFDVIFDPSVATYSGFVATDRAAGMQAEDQAIGSARARVVLHHATSQTLGIGSGAIGTMSFALVGSQDAQSTVAGTGIVLSDGSANEVPGDANSGVLSVTTGPAIPPSVNVSVLKNPGRTRTLDIYVSVENGSGQSPTLTLNSNAVTVTSFGGGIYHALVSLANDVESVSISASDTNAEGTGTDSRTVNF